MALDVIEENKAQNEEFGWVDSEGARNVLRRATQLATIHWTPILNVPNNAGVFAADSQVVGIPYSSTKEINKYVGFDVSFHTFMSAVHNPYSVLYTENISKPPYNGINCACYYGTVCSASVAYALGLDYPFTSNAFARSQFFREVEIRSLDDLNPCDVMYRSGHVFMIYKLEKDKGGRIKYVTVFEAAQTNARLTTYLADVFIQRIAEEKLRAFRYEFIEGVTDYTSTPYVPVGSEPNIPVSFNNSLCPSRGDKSLYRVDESIVIDVLDLSYDTLVFELGGEVSFKKEVKGNVNNIGCVQPGQYKVYLQKKGDNSDFVEIIVANPKIEVEITDKVHVKFQCDHAKPVYCSVVTQSGVHKFTHVLSDDEIQNGFVDFDVVEGGPYYYKVIFSTSFGTIINEPILACK